MQGLGPGRRPAVFAVLAALMATAGIGLGAARGAGPWPSPGGDEQAALTLPPSGGRLFGANDDFERDRGQRLLAQLRSAGANAARRTLSWWHAEPERDAWAEQSWAAAQRFHDGAVARGMTPIHVLGFAPPWARKAGTRGCVVVGRCEFPPRRLMIDEWAQFAAEAARRFPGAVFEVWNEPNMRDFWQPKPDPELWAELVAAAYAAIKAVDPAATTIACGCAGVLEDDGRGARMTIKEFLTRAYDHEISIRGRVDGISVHLFPQTRIVDGAAEGGVERTLGFGRSSMLAGLLDAVRSSAREHGEAPKPVWITEAGYWTRSRKHPHSEIGRRDVARALSRLARRAFSAAGIQALLVHRAQDTGRSDRSEFGTREASFGLIERGRALEPKPSFCVFAGLAGAHDHPGCTGIAGPAVRITRQPAGPRSAGVLRFGVEVPAETAAIECSVDRSPFFTCATGFGLGGYRSGPHELRVRGVDAAGRLGLRDRARWRVRSRGPSPRNRPCTVVGTAGDDALSATPGRDVICGLGGDDEIRGGDGGDLIRGGQGNDLIRGGAGSDRLAGGAGDDILFGGGGPDLILGGPRRDRAFGGPGSDRVLGGAGRDHVSGGRAPDYASGGPGADSGTEERYGRAEGAVFSRR